MRFRGCAARMRSVAVTPSIRASASPRESRRAVGKGGKGGGGKGEGGFGHRDGLGARPRFADDSQVWLGDDHSAQSLADHRVVVDQKDGGHAGTSTVTVVPPLGVGETVTVPPTCVTRDRIPRRPNPSVCLSAMPIRCPRPRAAPAASRRQFHRHGAGLCMSTDVGERFLRGAQQHHVGGHAKRR